MSKGQQRKAFLLSSGQENVDPGNFTFRQRTLGLDWRKVAGIDADEIRDTGNVELLQELIFTITFCNVDAEFAHSTAVDKNLLKLFKTSQLIIEYLIHCQECLLTSVNKNSQELIALREEVASLQEKLNAEKELSKKAKKECHKRRLLAAQYQAELMALKNGNVPREQFPCPDCPKIFLSNYYLKMHMAKRHNADMPPPPPALLLQQGGDNRSLYNTPMHQNVTEIPPRPASQQQQESAMFLTVKPVNDSQHREEIESLRSGFTRELNEMREKMTEWQRLAEQLRNTQWNTQPQVVTAVLKPTSPTPAPALQTTPVKPSNFGATLEDDVVEQEKRIMDQLGNQLNDQFVTFASQLDERVLQLSRGMADQLAADSRRHVDVLSEQISGLIAQVAKEREAKQLAERQRDEAVAAKQSVTYIQPPSSMQKPIKQSCFHKSKTESQSTPHLAVPLPYAPVPVAEVPIAAPIQPQQKQPEVTPKKEKKSFFEKLSMKFHSPKKATSSPSLAQQQVQQQQQQQQTTVYHQQHQQQYPHSSTLPRQSSLKSSESYHPTSAPALPKVVYQELPPQKQAVRQPDQPFLVTLMEDSVNKSTDSELTSRPSSSSPQHFTPQTPPKKEWQSAEPIPVSKSEPNKLPTPNDTLQASVTLPTMSAIGGNLGSTGPGEGAGSMYLAASTSQATVSGLVMRPRSAEDDSMTATTTDVDLAVRRQMILQLDQELAKRGVSKGDQGLSDDRFAALRALLEEERRKREFTHPDFFSNTRNQILSTVDKMARERAAGGGSTYRSEMSKTETSFTPKQVQVVTTGSSNVVRQAVPVTSANATPRADRSEIIATESQWTSEEDGSSAPEQQPRRPQNVTIPVVPAHVAAASSTAVVASSGTSPPGVPILRKSEPPPVVGRQPQHHLMPQRTDGGGTSLSGTTDDVSTMDVTSSIQDHPVRPNDFDETDSDDALIKKEMARYNIDTSAPTSVSPNKGKPSAFPSQAQPVFGQRAAGSQSIGSRPESSLTGISDDYDQDLGP